MAADYQFAEDYLQIELVLEVCFAFTEFRFAGGDTTKLGSNLSRDR